MTGKIRIGWDEKTINAPQVARMLEDCGIQRLAVHGRTRAQGYSGVANWDVIAEIAAAVRIPVIGNGDIASAHDVKRRRDTAGVAGVMIGRAAMGAPWMFAQAKAYLATGEIMPDPTPGERWEMVLRHCRAGGGAAAARRRARGDGVDARAADGVHARHGRRAEFARAAFPCASLLEMDDIAARHLEAHARGDALTTA